MYNGIIINIKYTEIHRYYGDKNDAIKCKDDWKEIEKPMFVGSKSKI